MGNRQPWRSGCFLHIFSWGWSGLKAWGSPPRTLLRIPKCPSHPFHYLLSNVSLPPHCTPTPPRGTSTQSEGPLPQPRHTYFCCCFFIALIFATKHQPEKPRNGAPPLTVILRSLVGLKHDPGVYKRCHIFAGRGMWRWGEWWGKESLCCSYKDINKGKVLAQLEWKELETEWEACPNSSLWFWPLLIIMVQLLSLSHYWLLSRWAATQKV